MSSASGPSSPPARRGQAAPRAASTAEVPAGSIHSHAPNRDVKPRAGWASGAQGQAGRCRPQGGGSPARPTRPGETERSAADCRGKEMQHGECLQTGTTVGKDRISHGAGAARGVEGCSGGSCPAEKGVGEGWRGPRTRP